MRLVLVCTDRQVAFADARRCPARVRGMAEAFFRAAHDVHVLAAGPQSSVEGIPVRELRLPVTVREVDWHFAQLHPDLVIEHWVPGQDACAEAAAEARVPLLLDVDSALLDGRHDDALLATLGTAGGVAGVLVASERDAAHVRRLAGPLLPVHVIEDAVRPELLGVPAPDVAAQVATRLRLGERDTRVGYVGPLTAEGGALDLLRAVAAAAHERALDPQPRVVLVGDGAARNAALALAFELGVRLTLCGRVAEDELGAHLAACGVVFAGRGAGPLPMLQAMACERAVIAHDLPDHRRIGRPGEDCWLVHDGDVPALATAIGELLAAPDRAARIGRRARMRVADGYTWAAQIERVAALGAGLAEAGARERAI
ncbi:MAG: glycosyltransferase family 4 protein [Candidatus Eisenbacteria bacterium]